MNLKYFVHVFTVFCVINLTYVSLNAAPSFSPWFSEVISPLDAASEAITSIDIEQARSILNTLDVEDPNVIVQRARLAMIEGNCDEASHLLSSDRVLSLTEESKILFTIARTCARAMAATVVETTPELIVRFQDDGDRVLVPVLRETLLKQRDVLARDLGVEMKLPLRVDVVRDQFSLSALSGLPHQAAQKTGTVAIAKFGRIILLSPRAPKHGYAWRDTLAHELTHLALSRGTLDHAPLWLQEGVAKREETRWRSTTAIDESLPADSIAAAGLTKGLGRPLDAIGASIALLPSAKEAMVVFAEVSSFVAFLAGDRADQPGASQDPSTLARLISSLKQNSEVNRALIETTGKDLKAWNQIWQRWVLTYPHKPLPLALNLDASETKNNFQKHRAQQQSLRIGELLLVRKHAKAARMQLDSLDRSMWGDPWVNTCIARARFESGDLEATKPLIEIQSTHTHLGLWWALRAEVLNARHASDENNYEAYLNAISHDPFQPQIACAFSNFIKSSDNWMKVFAQGLCASAQEHNTLGIDHD